jgi:hypothetical protein
MSNEKVLVDRKQLLTILVQLEAIQTEIKELKAQIKK